MLATRRRASFLWEGVLPGATHVLIDVLHMHTQVLTFYTCTRITTAVENNKINNHIPEILNSSEKHVGLYSNGSHGRLVFSS